MNGGQRRLKIHRQLLVKTAVIIVGNISRLLAPQRGLLVGLLTFDVNGIADKVGVLLDDLAQLPFAGQLGGIWPQKEVYFRAALIFAGGYNLKAIVAVGNPGHRF